MDLEAKPIENHYQLG